MKCRYGYLSEHIGRGLACYSKPKSNRTVSVICGPIFKCTSRNTIKYNYDGGMSFQNTRSMCFENTRTVNWVRHRLVAQKLVIGEPSTENGTDLMDKESAADDSIGRGCMCRHRSMGGCCICPEVTCTKQRTGKIGGADKRKIVFCDMEIHKGDW